MNESNAQTDDDDLLRLYADTTIVDYDAIPGIEERIRDVWLSKRRKLTLWERHKYSRAPFDRAGNRMLKTLNRGPELEEDWRRQALDGDGWQALFRDDPEAKKRHEHFEKLQYIEFWEIRSLTADERTFVDDEKALYQRYGIRWPCRHMATWDVWKQRKLTSTFFD